METVIPLLIASSSVGLFIYALKNLDRYCNRVLPWLAVPLMLVFIGAAIWVLASINTYNALLPFVTDFEAADVAVDSTREIPRYICIYSSIGFVALFLIVPLAYLFREEKEPEEDEIANPYRSSRK